VTVNRRGRRPSMNSGDTTPRDVVQWYSRTSMKMTACSDATSQRGDIYIARELVQQQKRPHATYAWKGALAAIARTKGGNATAPRGNTVVARWSICGDLCVHVRLILWCTLCKSYRDNGMTHGDDTTHTGSSCGIVYVVMIYGGV
jgi:hypothetical protein